MYMYHVHVRTEHMYWIEIEIEIEIVPLWAVEADKEFLYLATLWSSNANNSCDEGRTS